MRELADSLRAAEVDPDRYVLLPLLTEPGPWQLRPEGSVWLTRSAGLWRVVGGGIGPHYDATGDLCTFTTEERACETFLREMTGPTEPFAAEKARFSADCVRQWWEDEVRIALEDPAVAADRRRWRETWRVRELHGRQLMMVDEVDEAMIAAGVHREAFQLEGVDETDSPREGATVVLSHDDKGRWFWGRWDTDRPGLLRLQYRFETEGEACQSLYQECSGPLTVTAPLTLAQWRLQRSVALDNQAAAEQYDEQLQWRLRNEPPTKATGLPGWLTHHGVEPERYWISGMTWREAQPDAVCLISDGATGRWHAEGGLRGGRRAVLRRFASEEEAVEVFQHELTRPDGAPFTAEPTAGSAEAG
ncbi:hypothetical protein [Actinoplanes sp. NPDC049316]|uniref:hypothetical protein n=1 Tax=Actinoplanes sp. NPDC049316 TaxID=3154727 RepID=UPI00343F3861